MKTLRNFILGVALILVAVSLIACGNEGNEDEARGTHTGVETTLESTEITTTENGTANYGVVGDVVETVADNVESDVKNIKDNVETKMNNMKKMDN